jgi:hypothetical protein
MNKRGGKKRLRKIHQTFVMLFSEFFHYHLPFSVAYCTEDCEEGCLSGMGDMNDGLTCGLDAGNQM